jgi:Na+/H+ antiporter NhaD/arsenite permease-like protein
MVRNRRLRRRIVVGLAGATIVALAVLLSGTNVAGAEGLGSVAGRVLEEGGAPVAGAEVVLVDGNGNVLAAAETQEDGSFVLDIEEEISSGELTLRVEHAHFVELAFVPNDSMTGSIVRGEALRLPDFTLARRITAGFWVATVTFIAVLVLIALERLHSTTAALLGTTVVLIASFVLTPLWPDLFIFDFEQALHYVDWEVIFLVMGMMIVVGIIEGTGIFQWLAYWAYRLSRGRAWLLVIILMVITGVASALLDNVTTMLLVTPITLQIALAMGINPLSLLIPEVLASNVTGIATLIGTPTNIMIGSYASITFNDFLQHQTIGVLMAMIALVIYVELLYLKEFKAASANVSAVLAEKLRENSRITDPQTLIKSGLVFGVMMVFFITGESFHLVPAVTALAGATILLLWLDLEIDRLLKAVDWTTLMFFIALFVVVGAIQEVGLISFIAQWVARLIGENLVVAMLAVVWLSALLSTVVASIPFTAAMLPVVGFLMATVPGAESKVLFYGLSIGTAMGGNGSLIGSSSNLVTAGIAERAGFPITYWDFLRVGFPSMIVTVVIGCLWLLIHF